MYHKIHCDWFLSDGIFAPIRLDAPMYVEEALVSAGRIRADMTNEEHMAVEWIYRRVWKYATQFELNGSFERAFLRISSLKGSWRALINGAEAASGRDGSASFEISATYQNRNTLEILFEPAGSDTLRPTVGFGGMLSARRTGKAAITKLDVTEDSRLFAAVDMSEEGEVELRCRLKNSRGKREKTMTQSLAFGYNPLVFGDMSKALAAGENNELSLEVYCAGEMSDSCEMNLFISDERVQPRGFVAQSEEMISLAESAGAISAFTPDAEPDFAHRLLSARHGLESLSSDGLILYTPRAAALPLDRLIAIAGSEDKLLRDEVWRLAGADKSSLDVFRALAPSGEMEKLIVLSRYTQACDVRRDALEARLNDRYFVLDNVGAREDCPASSALMDAPGQMRPAYYALMGAWQGEVGYVKLCAASEDTGILNCEVYYVSDREVPSSDALSVSVYDLNGTKCLTNSFPALSQGCVGRFTFELPEGGAALVRTSLVKGEESVMSTDETVLGENVTIDELPITQLLAADGKITNVGETTALGVCVPGAAYFGCLLPGEFLTATRGDPDAAEGLNIFI